MRTNLTAILDPSPVTVAMLGAIALLAASVGPKIPARFVFVIASWLGTRWRLEGIRSLDQADTFWMLRAIRDRDESLMWLSFAVLCSLAGAVSLLTLLLMTPFAGLHDYLMGHFFWTQLTLTLFEWASVTLLIGGAWAMNGLVAAALAPVVGSRAASRRSPPGVAAGVLLGLGIAWILHEIWADRSVSGTQEVLFGVLPMFGLSVLAVCLSQQAERRRLIERVPEPAAPELTEHAEGWIWLALLAWGMGSVLVGSGWLACRSVTVSGELSGNRWMGWYVVAMGVSVSLASGHARRRKQSASGCGMALWAAGVGAGVAATLAAYWPAGLVSGLIQMAMIVLPVGYALHYGERGWLARAGSETLGFARMTTVILCGCAISLIAACGWVLPGLGPMGTIGAGGLMMLAVGGLIQIYEEDAAPHTQRQRLAFVFASLAGAIAVFPANARHWGQWWWSVQAEELECGPPLERAQWADARQICLLGVGTRAVIRELGDYEGQVDAVPLWSDARPIPDDRLPSTRVQWATTNGFRTLRLDRKHYDLVYQRSPRPGTIAHFPELSSEWLAQLAQRTAPGGRILVDLPLAGMTISAVTLIAATFEHAVGTPCQWQLLDPDQCATLRLKGTPGVPWRRPHGPTEGWSPISRLMEGSLAWPGLHTLGRDRLTWAMATRSDGAGRKLSEWLNARRWLPPAVGPLETR